MNSPRLWRRAFTLPELVAVLALIMCLIGLMLPVYAGKREDARRTTCQSNVKQLCIAVQLYSQDYSGEFPPAATQFDPVLAYTKNMAVFACPSEPGDVKAKYASGTGSAKSTVPFVNSAYFYRGGLASDSPAGEPLAMDWGPWHNDGRDVGYVDGHVRWFPESRLPLLPPTSRQARAIQPEPEKPNADEDQ